MTLVRIKTSRPYKYSLDDLLSSFEQDILCHYKIVSTTLLKEEFKYSYKETYVVVIETGFAELIKARLRICVSRIDSVEILSSYSEARAALNSNVLDLRHHKWFKKSTIEKYKDAHHVVVHVSHVNKKVLSELPEQVNGVRVEFRIYKKESHAD